MPLCAGDSEEDRVPAHSLTVNKRTQGPPPLCFCAQEVPYPSREIFLKSPLESVGAWAPETPRVILKMGLLD